MTDSDRYARQRLIEWWDQKRLRSARVLVAGVGAIGNEVLKNLVLLGIGHLILVDFDRIESSNLSRTILFTEADVGRSKARAAADSLTRMSSETMATIIDGDLFYDVGLGYYRHSDLAIGCLDNLAARSQVGLDCALAGIPYLDGGMWSLGGEVRWFGAGEGPCFDCTLSAEDYLRSNERRSCSGFRNPDGSESEPFPTLISTTAIIGGLLVQEAAKYLCGHPVATGKAIVYNGQTLTLHRAELARNPACTSSHYPYEDVIELSCRADRLTPRQLLTMARSHRKDTSNVSSEDGEFLLELGRDFLLALECPRCGHRQDFNRPTGKVLATTQRCPRCETPRRLHQIHALDENSPYAGRPLTDLGVPPGEVLAVRTPKELLLYELTGDIVS